MRHTRGRQYTEALPGRFDGVLLYFWPGLAARVEPGRTSNGRYGDRLVRMLLSFQRPSRPCGLGGDSSGTAQPGSAPSGEWSLAHRPRHRKARRGSTAVVQRSTGAPEWKPRVSDHAQAPEMPLAELQNAAVEGAGGQVERIRRERLAVQLDASLGQRPPRFGPRPAERLGDHGGQMDGAVLRPHERLFDLLGQLVRDEDAIEACLRRRRGGRAVKARHEC